MPTADLTTPTTERKHILTVSVEDYFHVGAFEGRVLPKHWSRFQPRLDRNIDSALELLGRFQISATFFVLGCIAEREPEVVQRIVAAGHEVASSGFWPRGLSGMTEDEFREDLRRAHEAIEAAGAPAPVGYRAARTWLREEHLWILRILAEEGYLYDSSVNPILRRFAAHPALTEVYRYRLSASDLQIWELPISTIGIFGLRVGISGGNYIRQIPHTLLRHATAWWDRNKDTPMVFYIMPWELDREQPKIRSISMLTRIRHYRNLEKALWVLEYYFQRYRFQSAAQHLGLDSSARTARESRPAAAPRVIPPPAPPVSAPPARDREPVTVVVPVYNEEENVTYLKRTILNLQQRFSDRYRLHLVLVDDGSRDHTWALLQQDFAAIADCQLVRHPRNLGVAAAMMTGIRCATTEVVCTMDCDCSYDPNDLAEMIPLLGETDLVTASPYHPQGGVFNVPPWRLFLSHTLSRLYSLLLRDRLHTYTSCFRVHRRSFFHRLDLHYPGFLGVAEMLLQAKLVGGRIVEFPTTLEARLLGVSKMKTLRAIRGHLGLLVKLALRRSSLVPKSGAREVQCI